MDTMCEERTQRQKYLIAASCYDRINMVFYAWMFTTAPERPVTDTVGITRYVTTLVDQFKAHNLAAIRDTETAKLGTLRTKADRTGIQFKPGI